MMILSSPSKRDNQAIGK